ncbi:anti-sigma factor [Fervidibacillus halotolerans]|uniref:Anti-sigma-W factor RsiW n=1 Tax=Fervidibacillus halotolerans TaxID=2980027 RepID=A0A9E8RY73_9BACI|nr:anti-sigma factor [Fervidibacillus halotolerans]WAA11928.1 anti-sigma factor [Fervidibacillus halotolerans]
MKRAKHISEQKIIDFLSGELPEKEAEQIQSHLHECENCMNIAVRWGKLLKNTHLQPVQPSPELKEQMWKMVDRKPLKKRKGYVKPIATVLSFAAAISLFLLIFNGRPEMDKPYEVVKNDEIPFETFHATPNTKQWNIVPTMNHQQINGNIWINDDTNEMFLEVDGLPHYRNRDYQLWIIYSNNDVEGELLILQNGSSRIFFQGIDVEKFKLIKASVEPKGGSTHQTGPDTFFVDFEHSLP